MTDASKIHKQETAFSEEFSAYLSNLRTLVVPMKRRLRNGGGLAAAGRRRSDTGYASEGSRGTRRRRRT
jgi:hypothetical protein